MPTKLEALSLLDAYGVTIPAGTAFRAVAQMVRLEGVPATMQQLAREALESGRCASYPAAMRYAADRISDLERFVNGEDTEVAAYRRLKADRAGLAAVAPTPREA